MKIRYILLLLGLLMMPTAYSRVFYVSPTGNDVGNSGTKTNPFASVMRAQQAVEAGDTVYFRGGKYLIQENQIALKQGIWAMVNVLDKSVVNRGRGLIIGHIRVKSRCSICQM